MIEIKNLSKICARIDKNVVFISKDISLTIFSRLWAMPINSKI
jgi:hypothetical protein